jgi:hypothetical protein
MKSTTPNAPDERERVVGGWGGDAEETTDVSWSSAHLRDEQVGWNRMREHGRSVGRGPAECCLNIGAVRRR